jgi:hypothetical protein
MMELSDDRGITFPGRVNSPFPIKVPFNGGDEL